jgi:hypothetical protein
MRTEKNPEKTETPVDPEKNETPVVAVAQVVAVDGVPVGQTPAPQAFGVPCVSYDGTDSPQRMPSKMDQIRDFLDREWCHLGPIAFTTKRLLGGFAFLVFGIMFILQITGVTNFQSGDGSSGGGGGGSFIAGTRVKLEDGTWQCIEEIRIGDRVALGGRVTARMEFESEMDDLFLYPVNSTDTPRVALNQMAQTNPIIVAGGHAVLENQHWRRVRSSPHAKLIESERFQGLLLGGQEAVRVFDIDVERHRLVVHPGVPSERLNSMPCKPLTLIDNSSVVFADFSEVDVAHEAVQQFETELLNALQKSQNEMIEL